MKHIAYKIIVIASVLLGVLGPQVALGDSTGEEILSSYKSQLPSIVVSDDPSEPASLSSMDSFDSSCLPQSDSIRLDLLLWQGCSELEIAPQPEIPQIVVISQPTYLPTIIAQTPSSNWKLNMLVDSGDRPVNSVLPILGFSFKPSSINQEVLMENSAKPTKSTSNFNQKNYMQIIIMRC